MHGLLTGVGTQGRTGGWGRRLIVEERINLGVYSVASCTVCSTFSAITVDLSVSSWTSSSDPWRANLECLALHSIWRRWDAGHSRHTHFYHNMILHHESAQGAFGVSLEEVGRAINFVQHLPQLADIKRHVAGAHIIACMSGIAFQKTSGNGRKPHVVLSVLCSSLRSL